MHVAKLRSWLCFYYQRCAIVFKKRQRWQCMQCKKWCKKKLAIKKFI